MAAFTLSADTNIDALSGKTGGDTYNTNGFKLMIDQDSRVGTNQTTSTSLGSITINASKGGEVHFDGTGIWIIPYTGGSGNVPAWNTTISNGSGSGKLIGVFSSLAAASMVTGLAMPASGFIRVKQKTGTFQAGALTGITATASNAGRVGWLEIVGDEAATVNANRLGTFRVTGAWFSLGTTNGSANQQLQVPNNGLPRHCPGVYIEKTAGQADYEFYANAGTGISAMATDATRGKVVFIDGTGLVRIGHNGTSEMGYVPASGLAVVVPNIFFESCTTAARTTNATPNATLATRYDFTCTGGGVIEIDKACMNWYLSASQAYSVNVSNSCFTDAVLLDEIASAMTWSKVGVGNKATSQLATNPLTVTECFAGGTFTDCVWQRVSMAASGAHTNVMTDCDGFDFVRDTIRCNTIRGNATTYSLNATRITDCTWTDPVIIQGAMTFTSCSDITVTGTTYAESVSSTTVTTYAGYVWTATSFCSSMMFDGLTLPVTNNHPYTAITQVASGSRGVKIRNIGTRASPLTMGSANACGYALVATTSSTDIAMQRVYVSNTRTGLYSVDNSIHRLTLDNCAGDYADADSIAANKQRMRACASTPSLTAQSAVYGTHWVDTFTSTTAGRLHLMLNEPNALTADYVALTGGAGFTGAGGLYMPTIGMTATFTMDYYCIGHTGFQNSALVMAGGTATNYTYAYQIDKNDGNGFSSWSSELTATNLGTSLNGLTGIDASLGFKLKLRITTGTTNTTAITSAYLLTNSSTTAQDYQYPLDVNTVTFTGLPTGCDAVTLVAGTSTILDQKDAQAGTSYAYTYSGAQSIDVGFIKPGYVPFYIRNLALTANDTSIPVSLALDRNYA